MTHIKKLMEVEYSILNKLCAYDSTNLSSALVKNMLKLILNFLNISINLKMTQLVLDYNLDRKIVC